MRAGEDHDVSPLPAPVSPSALLASTRAWFAATFAKACECPALDVRIHHGRLECGRCGARIATRAT